jgi:hypothetical protein
MTLQAYPVKIEDGQIRTMDGSPLPERAYAVLVILPEPAQSLSLEEWQKPFDAFFGVVRQSVPARKLDEVSDDELNRLVHTARAS